MNRLRRGRIALLCAVGVASVSAAGLLSGCGDDSSPAAATTAPVVSPAPTGTVAAGFTAANSQKVVTIAEGLGSPTQFAFADGAVFVAAGGDGLKGGGVYQLADGAATALPDSPKSSFGVAFQGDTLYASAGPAIVAWTGWDGTSFTGSKTVATAEEGTPGFNGLAFGPDGKLYAGVTLAGEKYDHSHPALPNANTLVAIDVASGDISTVATGLRQPWMPLFVPDAVGVLADGPLVTELAGSNPGKADPTDMLVVATQGSDFGFPGCLRSTPTSCPDAAQPWLTFPGHTSPMGLASYGDDLYVGLFGKSNVSTVPLAGGETTPFLTGFTAGVIAVGVDGSNLYAGDASGQVVAVPLA